MHTYHLEINHPKGWFAGPWNSDLAVSVGFANFAIDEPHRHTRITEIYLVGRGQSDLCVAGETLHLEAGDVVVVEPGEAHTFLNSSSDYFHFVIHTPGLSGAEAQQEKVAVAREEVLTRREEVFAAREEVFTKDGDISAKREDISARPEARSTGGEEQAAR